MIPAVDQFPRLWSQPSNADLQRRKLCLELLLIDHSFPVEEFNDIFIQSSSPPGAAALKHQSLVPGDRANPRQKSGASPPRRGFATDCEENFLNDVLRIRQIGLDGQHIAKHRLLVTHKQLLDVERVRVRRAGGCLVHHEKTAAVPRELAEKFGRERGAAGQARAHASIKDARQPRAGELGSGQSGNGVDAPKAQSIPVRVSAPGRVSKKKRP
jgi:hypothetical protein